MTSRAANFFTARRWLHPPRHRSRPRRRHPRRRRPPLPLAVRRRREYLANISTRMKVGTGQNAYCALYPRFSTEKLIPRRLVPRSPRTVWPTVLEDPVLELRDSAGVWSPQTMIGRMAPRDRRFSKGIAPTNSLSRRFSGRRAGSYTGVVMW